MFFPYFYLLMFYQCGTVFQTAFLTTCYNPETSSRVTLASLGIGFQPNPPSMPLRYQKPTPIFLYFYLLIFFHPFNPYNPCSFHLRVFFRTRIYRIDADASLGLRVSPLDKIRYILIIRVRFTTEFFFAHGFIGLTRMFRSWRYCLPY